MTPQQWLLEFFPQLCEQIPTPVIGGFHAITSLWRGNEQVVVLVKWPGQDNHVAVQLQAEDFAMTPAELALDIRQKLEERFGALPCS